MPERKTDLNISDARLIEQPFPHFVTHDVFLDRLSLTLLERLEEHAAWRRVTTDFYDQYEFNVRHAQASDALSFLTGQDFLRSLRRRMEKIFGTRFEDTVDVIAHKLVAGQQIEIHNDYIPGEETHRLIIHLNRGWGDEDGGELIFYNSANPGDVFCRLSPNHNSAVGFTISADSYHAVPVIKSGERYTLVFSLYKLV